MDRRQLPPMAVAPDLPVRISEVRAAERSGKHEARNEREVVA